MRGYIAPLTLPLFFISVGVATMSVGQDSLTVPPPAPRSLGDFSTETGRNDQQTLSNSPITPQNWESVPNWQTTRPWEVDLGIPSANLGLAPSNDTENLNIVTLNAYRRWSDSSSAVSPYLGAGVGITLQPPLANAALPNASVQSQPATGAAMQFVAGAAFDLGDNLSVFGQVQGSYALNLNDSDDGNWVSANRLDNGINIGLSLGF